MPTAAIGRKRDTAAFRAIRERVRGQARFGALVPLALITAVAAVLRFRYLGQVPGNPYYDAAVRTMATSWHSFLYGAFEPGGSVSVDKPPVDLWFQVLSVKLFGFHSTSLKLPPALAGTLTVVLLYDLVRRPFGRGAGLAAAAALAVSPIAVLTGRSDTMDTVMAALVVLAAWLIVRALERDRILPLLGAGAALGLAFNVKLFEALVAAPALAVLFLAGSAWPWRRRLIAGAAAVGVFLVVSFAWIVPVALTPASSRPYPIGTTNGSIWQLVFKFNGIDRLTPRSVAHPDVLPPSAKVSRAITAHRRHRHRMSAAGTTRLFDRQFGMPIGSELLPALLFGGLFALAALVLAVRRGREPPDNRTRLRRGFALALAVWIATGFVLFSHVSILHERYVETITPAIAAALGIGVAELARMRARWLLAPFVLACIGAAAWALHLGTGGAAAALAAAGACVIAAASAVILRERPVSGLAALAAGCLALVACLAVPVNASTQEVRQRASDSEHSGSMSPDWALALTRYVLAHDGHARYFIGSIAPAKVAPLLEVDPKPVLMLTSYRSRPLISVPALRAKVQAGEVRFFLLGHRCSGADIARTAACPPTARWVIAHGTDVTGAAGVPHGGLLYRIQFPLRNGR